MKLVNIEDYTGPSDDCQGGIAREQVIAHFDLVELTLRNSDINRDLEFNLYDAVNANLSRVGNPTAWYYSAPHDRFRQDFYAGASQIIRVGRGRWTLGSIRIANTDRTAPYEHHLNILAVGDLLEGLGADYHIQRAEIALDTLYKPLADELAMHIMPTWFRHGSIGHYVTIPWEDRDVFFPGGSWDGYKEQIFRGRPKPRESMNGKKYVQQPRRQFVSYPREENGLWRWEIRLFRPYLRAQSVNTVDELFDHAPDLIRRNIRFITLDRAELRRYRSTTKSWRMSSCTVREQPRELHQRLNRRRSAEEEISISEIKRRFFPEIDGPPINVCLFRLDDLHVTDHLEIMNSLQP